jgi:hypothetical protein
VRWPDFRDDHDRKQQQDGGSGEDGPTLGRFKRGKAERAMCGGFRFVRRLNIPAGGRFR